MYITPKELDRRIHGAAAALLARQGLRPIQPEVIREIAKEFTLPAIGTNIDDDVVAQTIVTVAYAPHASRAVRNGKSRVKAIIERGIAA